MALSMLHSLMNRIRLGVSMSGQMNLCSLDREKLMQELDAFRVMCVLLNLLRKSRVSLLLACDFCN